MNVGKEVIFSGQGAFHPGLQTELLPRYFSRSLPGSLPSHACPDFCLPPPSEIAIDRPEGPRPGSGEAEIFRPFQPGNGPGFLPELPGRPLLPRISPFEAQKLRTGQAEHRGLGGEADRRS